MRRTSSMGLHAVGLWQCLEIIVRKDWTKPWLV